MPDPGATLSHYRLVEKIGEGGMGQVWKATDTRLGREVALKLLPEHLVRTPERLERFAREAKLLASLNHPGIATIHDVDEHEGIRFIVMELVAGEDLAERLRQGPLPVAEALDVALQIARALEEAHGQGVVHRDLKPANVKMTGGGQVKVLDFGLAKAFAPDASSDDARVSASPTVTSAGTVVGAILGTAAYMSPEQARGRAVDKRTDVWSFGVLLYELLTGDNPFHGESVADSVGAIMHRDPDLDALPPRTPAAIRRLLKRCLTRERGQRLHDIADARIEIEEAIAHPDPEVETAAAARPSSKAAWAALLVLLPLAAALGWWLGGRKEGETPPSTRRFMLATDVEVTSPVISPDGLRVAYLVDDKLMIRALDAVEPRELAVEVGPGARIFWSPRSDALGVLKQPSEILRVDLDGGAPRLVTDAAEFASEVVWGDDGHIYFATFQGGIQRVSEGGGAPSAYLEGQDAMIDYHGFEVLPDGQGLLTVPHLASEDDAVKIFLERTGHEPELIYTSDAGVGRILYSPTGHILFGRRETPRGLWALPYVPGRIEAGGEPFLVVANLDGGASVSNTGDLVYGMSALQAGDPEQNLVWLDRSGRETRRLDLPIYGANHAVVSPDGSKAALVAKGVGRPSSDPPSVWVIDLERETGTRLSTTGIVPTLPVWNADGTRVAYVERGKGAGDKSVVSVRADGSGDREVLMAIDIQFFLSLSRDWTRAAFMRGTMQSGSKMSIATQRAGEDSAATFVDTPGHDVMPQIHPGGNWLAYLSGDIPEMEVFVRPFPEGDGQWKVSKGSALDAWWSADGKTLYYSHGSMNPADTNRSIFAVSFDDTGTAPSFGAPTKLFELETSGLTATPDDRLVHVETEKPQRGDEAPDVNGIVLVENWAGGFDTKD